MLIKVLFEALSTTMLEKHQQYFCYNIYENIYWFSCINNSTIKDDLRIPNNILEATSIYCPINRKCCMKRDTALSVTGEIRKSSKVTEQICYWRILLISQASILLIHFGQNTLCQGLLGYKERIEINKYGDLFCLLRKRKSFTVALYPQEFRSVFYFVDFTVIFNHNR